MSYMRPGIQVIQEFEQIVPTLTTPTLSSVIVGPAYQVVANDSVGSYSGSSAVYAYTSILPGAIVDLTNSSSNLLNYPVRVFIRTGAAETAATRTVGATTQDSANFEDTVTANAFLGAAVGDKLIITTGTDAAEYTIAALYEGDVTKVRLNSELSTTATGVSYKMERLFSEAEIPSTISGVTIDSDSVTLPAGLLYNSKSIVSGTVYLRYRALRPQLASTVKQFESFDSLEATFGVGQVVPQNPLAFGVNLALQNTTTPIYSLGLDDTYVIDEVQAYQEALNELEKKSWYCLVPLTQNPVVHQLFDTHVEALSMPARKKERIALINRTLRTTETIVDETTTSGSFAVTPARTGVGIANGTTTFKDTSTPNAFLNVQVGDLVSLTDPSYAGDYAVATKVSNSELTLGSTIATSSSSLDYQIKRLDGLWRDGVTFYDSNATFITAGLGSGHYIEVSSPSGFAGRYEIATVNSETKVTLSSTVAGAPYTAVTYIGNRDFEAYEEAEYLAAYARAFANRRLVMVWPDVMNIPVGSVVTSLPGYFAGCGLAGMVSGLPAHQGFTNLTLTGYVGFEHSSDRYTEVNLDTIAEGGVLILDQEVEEAPLYVRHQLTTDTSAIVFQELSITKNVDSIAIFARGLFAPYIGSYNITESLMDMLKTIAQSGIEYLKGSRLPKIGAPLKDGSLTLLQESATQPDEVEMQWDISIPYPFNRLKLTLLV